MYPTIIMEMIMLYIRSEKMKMRQMDMMIIDNIADLK